jgi:hypothetical protein
VRGVQPIAPSEVYAVFAALVRDQGARHYHQGVHRRDEACIAGSLFASSTPPSRFHCHCTTASQPLLAVGFAGLAVPIAVQLVGSLGSLSSSAWACAWLAKSPQFRKVYPERAGRWRGRSVGGVLGGGGVETGGRSEFGGEVGVGGGSRFGCAGWVASRRAQPSPLILLPRSVSKVSWSGGRPRAVPGCPHLLLRFLEALPVPGIRQEATSR